MLFVIVVSKMSIICFEKNERQRFKNILQYVLKQQTIQHRIVLKKVYQSIYDILVSSYVLPQVLNDIINDYMTDILIYDITLMACWLQVRNSSCIKAIICTHDVMINFVKYEFDVSYCINKSFDTYDYPLGQFGSKNNIFSITSDYYDIDFMPFFNFFMKQYYNKCNYVQQSSQAHYWNKYVVNNNNIKCEYPSDDISTHFDIRSVTFNIHDHRMLKNMIIMIKLLTNVLRENIQLFLDSI